MPTYTFRVTRGSYCAYPMGDHPGYQVDPGSPVLCRIGRDARLTITRVESCKRPAGGWTMATFRQAVAQADKEG